MGLTDAIVELEMGGSGHVMGGMHVLTTWGVNRHKQGCPWCFLIREPSDDACITYY